MEIGLFRIPIPDIDKSAFREVLVNAFCHRDYSLLGRIIIRLDDEGFTISNPGASLRGYRLVIYWMQNRTGEIQPWQMC